MGFWHTAPRVMNTLLNAYAGMVPKTFQKAVFHHGQPFPPGFEGGMPTWVYTEFPIMPAQSTDDIVMALPSHFVLLGYVAQGFAIDHEERDVPIDFRVQVYDVNGEIDFIPGKAANFGNIAGFQGRVLFERNPYTFQGSDPQCEVRIANLALVEADITFALYGLQGVPQ